MAGLRDQALDAEFLDLNRKFVFWFYRYSDEW